MQQRAEDNFLTVFFHGMIMGVDRVRLPRPPVQHSVRGNTRAKDNQERNHHHGEQQHDNA